MVLVLVVLAQIFAQPSRFVLVCNQLLLVEKITIIGCSATSLRLLDVLLRLVIDAVRGLELAGLKPAERLNCDDIRVDLPNSVLGEQTALSHRL